MIIQAIENQIFSKAAPMAIRYLKKPDPKTKHPLARKVLDQSAREFQVAPPVTIHISDPDLMAGLWSATREAYVVNAKGRAKREAVAAAVSALNECPYCVTVHASMFASTGADARQLSNPSELPPDIAAAHKWAAATLAPDSDILHSHQIPPHETAQIFATAVLYHYINRVVSVFLEDSPVALPGMMTGAGQKITHASFKFFGRRITKINPEPGQSVGQTSAKLPAEFSWAASNPDVARAMAYFASTAENAGHEAVSETVRALVTAHLAEWRGEKPPLSRAWVEELVTSMPSKDKPAARLALMVARAPWQIDDSLVNDFRKGTPDDKALLQTVAWASFAATRRIASWL